MTTRRIDLRRFVSVAAHPGEKVVFSPFTSTMDIDHASNTLDQTQRRKNARIFMEACLFANGGNGQSSDKGWYLGAGTSTTNNYGSGGTVYIGGTLPMEPYADGAYFPNFGGGYWTVPAGINILGNGAMLGDSDTWSTLGMNASRIVVWGTHFGWSPRGGPAVVGSTARSIGGWHIDNIAIVRRGNTAGDVFLAEHWHESDALIHTNENWKVGNLLVECEPGSGTAAQNGARFACGFHCAVEKLDVMGHANPGWGLLVHGLFKSADGAFYTHTTTIDFGQVRVHGTLKGVGVSHADFYCRMLNLECTATQSTALTSRQRLVFGDRVWRARVGTLWAEGMVNQASGYQGIVVTGLTTAEMKTLGALPSWVTAADSANWGIYEFPYVPVISNRDGANIPDTCFLIKSGRLKLGSIWPANVNSLWKIEPRAGLDADACGISWDATMARTTGGLLPPTSMTPRPEDAAGYLYKQYVVDRARAPNMVERWESVTANTNYGSAAFNRRFTNAGAVAGLTFTLPSATAADEGKRVSFMKATEQDFQIGLTGNDYLLDHLSANGYAYLSIPFVVVTFEVTAVQVGADEMRWALVEGANAVGFRRSASNAFVGQINYTSTSSPITLSPGTHANRTLTNYGTTALVQFTLPSGSTATNMGYSFEFWRIEPYEVRIVPTATAKIGDGVVNKYLSMLTDGSVLKIRLIKANHWGIENSTGVYEFQA